MADIEATRAELDGDPLGRGYISMNDTEAADDIFELLYRDGPAQPGALFAYLAKETAKDHSTEPVPTAILGRLYRIDEAGVVGIGQPTFAGSQTPGPFSNLTAQSLDACRTLLQMALGDRLATVAEQMTEQKMIDLLNLVKDAGVMKPADVTNIQALSQNKRTRAQELGLGFGRKGQIAEARALP